LKLKLSRATMLAASITMLVAFLQPLWHYDFNAPQYPEGLSIIFYLDHLGGRVDLVNELNHYVGMRKIADADFIEFRAMPCLVGLFCLAGIAVAVSARLWALVGWVAAMAAAGLIGMADFYSWLYLYGHQLNPHAAIRIPPFTPQMLGSYRVMNFQIASYPGGGGIAIMLAFVLGLAALAIEWANGSFGGGRIIPAREAILGGRRSAGEIPVGTA